MFGHAAKQQTMVGICSEVAGEEVDSCPVGTHSEASRETLYEFSCGLNNP